MKIDKIKDILLLDKNKPVKFIASLRNIAAIYRTVCAFLNTKGGVIICGIDEQGTISGVANPDKNAVKLEQQLREQISPKSLIEVSLHKIEKKSVLSIEVPAGGDFPYVCRNKFYLYENEQIVEADSETVRDMILRKSTEPIRWERRFSTADLDTEIDQTELLAAVKVIEGSRGFRFTNPNEIDSVLNDLSLCKYGRLTQAGDVLFGKSPAKRLPQIRVRAACFSLDKASDEYRDLQIFEGALSPMLEQVFDFILRNIPTRAKFGRQKLERQDEPIYPVQAIREGLVNAFAHRDYSDSSGGLSVHIYPKRLEIWNSGSLPDGITPTTLALGHLSILRNPDIAHVLYLRGRMEKIGRGSLLILRLCEEAGLPVPTWSSDKNRGVTLTFHAVDGTKSGLGRDQVGTKSGLSRDQVGTKLGLSPEQLKLVCFFNGEHRVSELMEVVGRSNRTKFREQFLNPLLIEEYIEMIDPEKPTSSKQKYRLTEKGHQLKNTKKKS
jgi:ATP-dependent DNA helicase RecG